MEEKSSFEDFQLGPLKKQQLVFEHFRFPLDKDIPQITTLIVFKALRQFSYQHSRKFEGNRDQRPRMGLDEFLEYFIQLHNYDTPFESGIKIQSIALGIQV